MTETTNIDALREAALKATKGRWVAFTDDGSKTYAVHTPHDKRCEDVIKWSGFDCQKNAKANAEFIALANPATIIALLDQLEAERQRTDAETKSAMYWNRAADQATERAKKAEAELAALRGTQEPVAWLNQNGPFGGVVTVSPTIANSWELRGDDVTPLFTRQPKPVVVLSDCTFEAVSHMAHWYSEGECAAWVSGVEHAKKQMIATGIVVKDGE